MGTTDDPRAVTVEALRSVMGLDGLARVLVDLLAEDVVWAGEGPGGTCRNRDDVLRVLDAQVEQGLRPVLEEVRSSGERILAYIGLAPGVGVWMMLRLDDRGRIAGLQSYSSDVAAERDLALIQAGAKELPADRGVARLVPFVHVADLGRSRQFYRQLGFESVRCHEEEGRVVWASLRSQGAELMLAEDDRPGERDSDAIFLYLYAADLRGLRDHLVAWGATVGEIVDGSPGPRAQMRVTDPDGYCLMVAETVT